MDYSPELWETLGCMEIAGCQQPFRISQFAARDWHARNGRLSQAASYKRSKAEDSDARPNDKYLSRVQTHKIVGVTAIL
jgi:hypothetical protein